MSVLRDTRSEWGPLLPDFEWLLDDERERVTHALLADVERGGVYEPQLHDATLARIKRSIPMAKGQFRTQRLLRRPIPMILMLDPAFPGTLWASFGGSNAELWSPITPGRLDLWRAAYTVPDPTPVSRRARRQRIAKKMDDAILADVIVSLLNECVWLNDSRWGSAHDDDPWVDNESEMSLFDQYFAVQDAETQHPTRRPSLAVRTLWSGAALRIEEHFNRLFCFELVYSSGIDSEVITRFNQIYDYTIPPDVPVDLAAALMCGTDIRADDEGRYAEGPALDLFSRVVLAPGDPSTIAAARQAIHTTADAHQRRKVLHVVDHYSMEGLLSEALLVETDDILRQELRARLEPTETT